MGAYIHHYELHGADRADYGDRLLARLAEQLQSQHMVRTQERELRRYRAFYVAYPQIRDSLSPESLPALAPVLALNIRESASPVSGTPLAAAGSPALQPAPGVAAHQLLAHAAAEKPEPRLAIRDPYVFEFLGLKASEAMAESDLEQAMLANLQEFLLELGHGFCLEARQKSIVIGQTRGFVDLVFYHRVLKCHVLVELKVDEFRHEHIGQLNTYVAWFEKNMMQPGDNPPVGLLLCTGKDHALVEYALSSMSDRLFVSKYQLELPSKTVLQQFLDEKLKEVNGVC